MMPGEHPRGCCDSTNATIHQADCPTVHRSERMGALTHIVGPPIEVDGRLRQRCAWCGAVLDDVDLASVAVSGETRPYPVWPEGAQVRVDGGFSRLVADPEPDEEHEADLAADSCARLPFEVTGSLTPGRER